jgi:hypothetical protein
MLLSLLPELEWAVECWLGWQRRRFSSLILFSQTQKRGYTLLFRCRACDLLALQCSCALFLSWFMTVSRSCVQNQTTNTYSVTLSPSCFYARESVSEELREWLKDFSIIGESSKREWVSEEGKGVMLNLWLFLRVSLTDYDRIHATTAFGMESWHQMQKLIPNCQFIWKIMMSFILWRYEQFQKLIAETAMPISVTSWVFCYKREHSNNL